MTVEPFSSMTVAVRTSEKPEGATKRVVVLDAAGSEALIGVSSESARDDSDNSDEAVCDSEDANVVFAMSESIAPTTITEVTVATSGSSLEVLVVRGSSSTSEGLDEGGSRVVVDGLAVVVSAASVVAVRPGAV